jgi:hypothetical protein
MVNFVNETVAFCSSVVHFREVGIDIALISFGQTIDTIT